MILGLPREDSSFPASSSSSFSSSSSSSSYSSSSSPPSSHHFQLPFFNPPISLASERSLSSSSPTPSSTSTCSSSSSPSSSSSSSFSSFDKSKTLMGGQQLVHHWCQQNGHTYTSSAEEVQVPAAGVTDPSTTALIPSSFFTNGSPLWAPSVAVCPPSIPSVREQIQYGSGVSPLAGCSMPEQVVYPVKNGPVLLTGHVLGLLNVPYNPSVPELSLSLSLSLSPPRQCSAAENS